MESVGGGGSAEMTSVNVSEGGSCLPVVLITTLLVYSLAMYSTYKHYGVGRGSKWGEVGAFFESSACPFFFVFCLRLTGR